MLSKVTEDYVLIEFSEETAAHLIAFLTHAFRQEGVTSWAGNVIVLEYDPRTQMVTIGDLFCEYPDQSVPWEAFCAWVARKRQLSLPC
ncbi:hypothetical protein J7382_01435 [Shimia sp. R11_0]|uniref:hypothetical protein n=1 Tax=Shimia sp. R11_0 TaxID=2821096 RepID=UPI001AD9B58D|nr:hypothetical protein [Shimia sp. R11_0]MBO9476185.1 hypothetical protein [Shimia sp. R11_0]